MTVQNRKPKRRPGEADWHGLYLPTLSGSKRLDRPTMNHDIPFGAARQKAVQALRLQCEPIPDREGCYRLPGTAFEVKWSETL
jgi:hypothetical protein